MDELDHSRLMTNSHQQRYILRGRCYLYIQIQIQISSSLGLYTVVYVV